MAQGVNCRALSAKVRVRSQVNPCEVSVRHIGTGKGFFPRNSVSLCLCHYLSAQYTSSTTRPSYEQDNVANSGNLPKGMPFRKSGSIGWKRT